MSTKDLGAGFQKDKMDSGAIISSNQTFISIGQHRNGNKNISVNNEYSGETYEINCTSEGITATKTHEGNKKDITLDNFITELRKLAPTLPSAADLLRSQPRGKTH